MQDADADADVLICRCRCRLATWENRPRPHAGCVFLFLFLPFGCVCVIWFWCKVHCAQCAVRCFSPLTCSFLSPVPPTPGSTANPAECECGGVACFVFLVRLRAGSSSCQLAVSGFWLCSSVGCEVTKKCPWHHGAPPSLPALDRTLV